MDEEEVENRRTKTDWMELMKRFEEDEREFEERALYKVLGLSNC